MVGTVYHLGIFDFSILQCRQKSESGFPSNRVGSRCSDSYSVHSFRGLRVSSHQFKFEYGDGGLNEQPNLSTTVLTSLETCRLRGIISTTYQYKTLKNRVL